MPGDGPAMSEAVSSSYEHLKPWMPWAKPEQTVEESEQLVRQFRGRWLLAEDFVIAIYDPDNKRALGGCGFHLRHGPISRGIAEIGMWIRADVASRGLGTHALESLLAWGFSEWPWERIVWQCDVDNLASSKVAEKAGMHYEGISRSDDFKVNSAERRDTAWYAALRSEA